MRHLLSVNDLSNEEVLKLTKEAIDFKTTETGIISNRTPVALIFLEPSTRTRVSMERAAQITGRRYVLLQNHNSSIQKGETLEDTILNLQALGLGMFVVRNSADGSLKKLADLNVGPVINGGDGQNEHPTQALIDFVTLYNKFGGKIEGLKVGIVGDLRHSRVAKSFSALAPRFGIKVQLISPASWKPLSWGHEMSWSDQMNPQVLAGLDVIMALRVQRERMDKVEDLLTQNYVENFQITASMLKPSHYLMHPGPVNWGVELSSDVKHDKRSLILEQSRLGLSVRAVIMNFLDTAK